MILMLSKQSLIINKKVSFDEITWNPFRVKN